MTAPETDPRSRLFPPGIAAASILVGVGLRYLWPLRLAQQPTGRWIGGALILAWLALAAFAVGVFRRAGTTPNPTGDVTAFVINGPYRYTRNPMYLGLVLLQVGIAFVLCNAWVLILAPVTFLLLDRIVIAGEERYLEAKYGAAYTDYRRHVRRWL
jgi:protein-S-isoprenylcysteine O-methyltransferase Ste14